MDLLAQRAIEEALRGNWKEASKINEEIIEEDPKNKEALNRVARAYIELGKFPKALSAYKKVLKIDPYNSIAQKALARLETLKSSPKKKLSSTSNGTNSLMSIAGLFIEEPGKTKTATLLHLGSPAIIADLVAGQAVYLTPHAHRVSAMTEDDEYIGRLPDDLASRIIRLTKIGNEYASFVRAVTHDQVKIFIREVKRCEELKNTPSFPSLEKQGYVSFTSPDSIHDEKPDVSSPEDDELE